MSPKSKREVTETLRCRYHSSDKKQKKKAYAVYKELESLLKKNRIDISPMKAIEAIKEIRHLQYVLPKFRQLKTRILQPSDLQARLLGMEL